MYSIQHVEIILYVVNQQQSTRFYTDLLRLQPSLNVPGMTEFILSSNCKLGLMPNNGIAKILQDKTPHPDDGNGIPRCELYLLVDQLEAFYEQALAAGAVLVSEMEDRNWGDRTCYFMDPDGHIIAFAEKIKSS
ncbi:MAG: VOC family protein [Chitinophagales bacterium]|nr:VOC family protein [Chitinophagales bacterium]